MKRILTGNEAVGLGALRAGVRVVTGYPGTPSTEALASLLARDLPGRHVEWSTNEKVAFEIAAGAAWAGRRALVTMKMSGLNVAYDAVVSIAYSGTNGGLVVYVADDPGVSAGMPEQDTRGFALMTDAPMLAPSSIEEAYRLAQVAFELSEAIGGLVFLRLTTAVALTYAIVGLEDSAAALPPAGDVLLERNIARYTKAGAAICLNQHQALLARLEAAGRFLHERGLHPLRLGKKGGLGIAVVGAPAAYLDEALATAGIAGSEVSVLHAASTIPFPTEEVGELFAHCDSILVLEELEAHFERQLLVDAQRLGFAGRVVGKLDGTLSRSGEYGAAELLRGLTKAVEPLGRSSSARAQGCLPSASSLGERPKAVLQAEQLAAARPITVCSGCPHRGTYMAIEAAIKKAGYKKDEVMVTGDIGCTILGMNPPFDLLWNEVSMGSSVSLAQGYVHAGMKTPVIATIGDSTFFHGGIPGVLNAVQHRVPLVVVVMDNGWTGLPGLQVHPGPAAGTVQLDAAKCVLCKQCLRTTGCPALSLSDGAVHVDPALCNGCGLCAAVCPTHALGCSPNAGCEAAGDCSGSPLQSRGSKPVGGGFDGGRGGRS